MDMKTELDVNFVKDTVFGALSNPEVEAALWPLLYRCVYNSDKITQELFDTKIEYRGALYEMFYHVAVENIRPFVKDLFVKYEPLLSAITANLKSALPKTS